MHKFSVTFFGTSCAKPRVSLVPFEWFGVPQKAFADVVFQKDAIPANGEMYFIPCDNAKKLPHLPFDLNGKDVIDVAPAGYADQVEMLSLPKRSVPLLVIRLQT